METVDYGNGVTAKLDGKVGHVYHRGRWYDTCHAQDVRRVVDELLESLAATRKDDSHE